MFRGCDKTLITLIIKYTKQFNMLEYFIHHSSNVTISIRKSTNKLYRTKEHKDLVEMVPVRYKKIQPIAEP